MQRPEAAETQKTVLWNIKTGYQSLNEILGHHGTKRQQYFPHTVNVLNYLSLPWIRFYQKQIFRSWNVISFTYLLCFII